MSTRLSPIIDRLVFNLPSQDAFLASVPALSPIKGLFTVARPWICLHCCARVPVCDSRTRFVFLQLLCTCTGHNQQQHPDKTTATFRELKDIHPYDCQTGFVFLQLWIITGRPAPASQMKTTVTFWALGKIFTPLPWTM